MRILNDPSQNDLNSKQPITKRPTHHRSYSIKRTAAWDIFVWCNFTKSTKLVPWFFLSKALSNIDSNSPWYSTFKVHPCNGPLRRIWLYVMASMANSVVYHGPLRWIWICAMGHCGEFGCPLWATASNIVLCYGPLHGMKPYSRIWDNFHAMGKAQDLVMLYGQECRFWWCTMCRPRFG